MYRLILLVGLLGQFLAVNPQPAISSQNSFYFDDSDPNFIHLGNDYYEFKFRKSNGSIAGIVDQATGMVISPGSRFECLWGTVFQGSGGAEFIGGCSYHKDWANKFTYQWLGNERRLLLKYTPDTHASHKVSATVTVQTGEAPWLDLQLHAVN